MSRRLKQSVRRPGRKGTAAVELAVCLPLLLLIVFGSIEICRWIHARESLHVAAYEAIRAAAKDETSSAEVISRAQSLLVSRGFDESRVQIDPTNYGDLEAGSDVRVTVNMPIYSRGSWLSKLLPPREFSVTAAFVKE